MSHLFLSTSSSSSSSIASITALMVTTGVITSPSLSLSSPLKTNGTPYSSQQEISSNPVSASHEETTELPPRQDCLILWSWTTIWPTNNVPNSEETEKGIHTPTIGSDPQAALCLARWSSKQSLDPKETGTGILFTRGTCSGTSSVQPTNLAKRVGDSESYDEMIRWCWKAARWGYDGAGDYGVRCSPEKNVRSHDDLATILRAH